MSNERLSKTTQRVSRYSRASYDDLAPIHYDNDLPLSEITERALEGETVDDSSVNTGPQLPSLQADETQEFHQPPPPDDALLNSELGQLQQRNAQNTDHGTETEWGLSNTHHQAERAEEEAEQEAQAEFVPTPEQVEELPRSVTRKQKNREVHREKSRMSVGSLKSGARAVGEKIGPLLMNSGLWLARNLRRREIRRRFSRLQIFAHTHFFDRKTERLFFVPSRMTERFDPALKRGIHYDGPVPVKAFEWLMAVMPDDLREYTFIDVRAELGRTTLLAAGYNFKRIVAYEYELQRFDDLYMNIAQYPRSRMVCRDIDTHRGDTDGIVIPDTPCIIYVSNAWREPMIDGITKYLSDSYQQNPRRIYIILGNTAASTTLENNTIFDLVEPPLAERMKLRLFSPVDFKIYRSIA